jgi:hypothetical protein
VQLPALLHGTAEEVAARCDGAIARLGDNLSWDQAMHAAELADTQATPGLLVLSGPSPLLRGESHFHCYLPVLRIVEAVNRRRLDPGVEEHVFQRSLDTAWGCLGLIAPVNTILLHPRQRLAPLVAACLRFWRTLDAEGERYSNGSRSGHRLWELHTGLHFALSNLGVAETVLNAPLPPEGLAAVAEAFVTRRPGMDLE